ncbi:MAG: hypothetical protein N4A35_03200 [Flavobacteriales bacterium]|jgi:hypothetical protein|nr:hypothetical protein [Flavobacteriales bacterium]
MKKGFTIGMIVILVISGVVSCKKTSKRKIANEWTVSKMSSEYIDEGPGGLNKGRLSIDGNSGSSTDISTIGDTSITIDKTVSVKCYDYTINKDGTFSINNEMTWTRNADGGVVYVDVAKNEILGKWAFLGKNKTDDFKKNELLVFYTTAMNFKGTNTVIENGTSTSSSSSKSITYSDHDYVSIYKVVASKSKELELLLESERKSSDIGDNGAVIDRAYKLTESLTLVQK